MRRPMMAALALVLPLLAALGGNAKMKSGKRKAKTGAWSQRRFKSGNLQRRQNAGQARRYADGVPSSFLQRLRAGRTNKAAEWLDAEQATRPGEPNLLIARAMLHTTHNEHHLAAPLYEENAGATVYARWGLRFHADTLRALGEGAAAAQLRTNRLHRSNYGHAQVQYENIARIHDLREAGALLEALEATDDAIAQGPHQGAIYAARAEVYIDLQDLDTAAFEILLAKERGTARTGATQTALAEARWLLAIDQPEEAVALLRPYRKRNLSNERFTAILGEAFTRAGRLSEAADALREVRYRRQGHPEVELARARLHLAMGDPDTAGAIADRLMEQTPGSPFAIAAVEEVWAHGIE